jgi:hypothetical protein
MTQARKAFTTITRVCKKEAVREAKEAKKSKKGKSTTRSRVKPEPKPTPVARSRGKPAQEDALSDIFRGFAKLGFIKRPELMTESEEMAIKESELIEEPEPATIEEALGLAIDAREDKIDELKEKLDTQKLKKKEKQQLRLDIRKETKTLEKEKAIVAAPTVPISEKSPEIMKWEQKTAEALRELQDAEARGAKYDEKWAAQKKYDDAVGKLTAKKQAAGDWSPATHRRRRR